MHLYSGTATANTAPLKFTSGTNLTTPEAGAVEYDGNALYATPVVDRHNIVGANSPITSTTTVNNTGAETTIFTGAISASELKVGRMVRARIFGSWTTSLSGHTATLRVKVAGTTIYTVAIAASVAVVPLYAEYTFTVRTTGAGGTMVSFLYSVLNNTIADFTQTAAASSALNTTAACDITFTWQWSAASASDTLLVEQGFLEFIH